MRTRFFAMTSWSILMSLLLAGCGPTAFKITPVPADQELEEEVVFRDKGWLADKILLIDVDGVLLNMSKPALLSSGENPVVTFVEKLEKAARDKAVKAIILRINSPGGSVTASDLMYSELQYYKQRTGGEKPVVAMLMDVAASGGYYLACGCDEIVAQPTTVTGSIGVIMQLVNFSGTMDKIGIEATAIKSGPMKNAGSPFKPLTPQEEDIFQSLVDDFYGRFLDVVVKGRPDMSEAEVRTVADGRVYSAEQALELGLIDRIATLRETVEAVKEQIGARRVRVVTYKRPLGWKPNVYAHQSTEPPQVNLININTSADWLTPQPQFLYLWAPGR